MADDWKSGGSYNTGDIVNYNETLYIATEFYKDGLKTFPPNEAMTTDSKGNQVRGWIPDWTSTRTKTNLWKPYFFAYETRPEVLNAYTTNIEKSLYTDPSNFWGSSIDYLIKMDKGAKPTYWDDTLGEWVYQSSPNYALSTNAPFPADQCGVGVPRVGNLGINCTYAVNLKQQNGQWNANPFNNDGQDKIYVFINFTDRFYVGKDIRIAICWKFYETTVAPTGYIPTTIPSGKDNKLPDWTSYGYYHFNIDGIHDYYYKITSYSPFEVFTQTKTATEDYLSEFIPSIIPDNAFVVFTLPPDEQRQGALPPFQGTDFVLYTKHYELFSIGVEHGTSND